MHDVLYPLPIAFGWHSTHIFEPLFSTLDQETLLLEHDTRDDVISYVAQYLQKNYQRQLINAF